MSKSIKKIVVLFMVCCFFTCALASCGSEGKAKSYIKDLFAAVAAGNYEKAESFVHPTKELDAKKYFMGLEEQSGARIDFQKGIKIEKYISIDHTDYNYEVDGELYVIKVRTRVSGIIVRFEIWVVDNVYGYGIYKLKTIK
jgi:hypothetical protein